MTYRNFELVNYVSASTRQASEFARRHSTFHFQSSRTFRPGSTKPVSSAEPFMSQP